MKNLDAIIFYGEGDGWCRVDDTAAAPYDDVIKCPQFVPHLNKFTNYILAT